MRSSREMLLWPTRAAREAIAPELGTRVCLPKQLLLCYGMSLVSIRKERWHVLALGLAVLLGSGLSTRENIAAASGEAEIPRPPPCEGELEVIGIVWIRRLLKMDV